MLRPSKKYLKTAKWIKFYFSYSSFFTANQIPNYLTLWLDQNLFSLFWYCLKPISYHILLHLYRVDFSIKKWKDWDLREILFNQAPVCDHKMDKRLKIEF